MLRENMSLNVFICANIFIVMIKKLSILKNKALYELKLNWELRCISVRPHSCSPHSFQIFAHLVSTWQHCLLSDTLSVIGFTVYCISENEAEQTHKHTSTQKKFRKFHSPCQCQHRDTFGSFNTKLLECI